MVKNSFRTYVIYGRQAWNCVDRVHDIPEPSCFHHRGCRRSSVSSRRRNHEEGNSTPRINDVKNQICYYTDRGWTASRSSLSCRRIKGLYFRRDSGAHQFPDHCTSTHCRILFDARFLCLCIFTFANAMEKKQISVKKKRKKETCASEDASLRQFRYEKTCLPDYANAANGPKIKVARRKPEKTMSHVRRARRFAADCATMVRYIPFNSR